MAAELASRAQWKRVTRRRGPASAHQCARCPARGRDWARVHTEDGQDPWADYVPLCRPCHRHYDRIGPGQAERKRAEAARRVRDAAGRFAVMATALALCLLALATMSAPRASASNPPRRLIALAWAEHQAGKWYLWGGTGPLGFDCSGLVWAAYRATGIILPRTTYGMLASPRLHWEPASARQRGDLAFFGPGHVELVTRRGTFGALESGTQIGWHHPSGWWRPTAYYRVG